MTRHCFKGGTPHLLSAHGTDGHEHPHNPWSERCMTALAGEPRCPDARCMTCDPLPAPSVPVPSVLDQEPR